MTNLSNALQQLQAERRQAQLQVEKLGEAIAAIEGLVGRSASATARNGLRPNRVVSSAARRKMAQAQRARWARWRSSHTGSPSAAGRTNHPKRTLSAAARRKIAQAQLARWAAIKAKQAKKAA